MTSKSFIVTVVFERAENTTHSFQATWKAKPVAECCDAVYVSAAQNSKVFDVLTGFNGGYLGLYLKTREDDVFGSPYYRHAGNMNYYLSRSRPMNNPFYLVSWIISDEWNGSPGNQTGQRVHLGGNVKCPHLADFSFAVEGASSVFESGLIQIECVDVFLGKEMT